MIKDLFKTLLLVLVKLLTVDVNAMYPNPKVIALIKDQREKQIFVSSEQVPLRCLKSVFSLFSFISNFIKFLF